MEEFFANLMSWITYLFDLFKQLIDLLGITITT